MFMSRNSLQRDYSNNQRNKIDVQGLVMLVLILLKVLMIAVAIDCMYKLKLIKNYEWRKWIEDAEVRGTV